MANLDFLNDLKAKYAHQPTFLQAVEEMALSLADLFEDPDKGDFYKRAFLAMTEPERSISFRVTWMDDEGKMRVNRGYRVEFSRYERTNERTNTLDVFPIFQIDVACVCVWWHEVINC